MDNFNIGKILIFAGVTLIITGVIFIVFNKFHIGNLPGDIHIKRDNYSIDIPIMTSVVISIVLTIIINIFIKFNKGQ